MSEGHLRIGQDRHGDTLVVTLAGDLDLATAPQVVSALQEASGEIGSTGGRLGLDMRDVGFIDSTGLRVLLRASSGLERPIVLIAPPPPVVRILDLTRLRGRFDEVDDISDLNVPGQAQ